LTPIEYKLLYQLTRNAGQVLMHDDLLSKVWGPEYLGELDYLRIYVRRLREKLEENPQQPSQILTERGLGYRFEANPRAA
ncbi:MAG: helix-turn-helix domain-containing protein, partial [Chloroflexota bacterium]